MEKPDQSDRVSGSALHEQEAVSNDSPTANVAEISRLRRLLEQTEKRAKEARQAASLLASIIKQLPVGLTVESESGETLLANDRAAELLGAAAFQNNAAPDAAVLLEASGSGESDSDADLLPVSATEDRIGIAGGERTILRWHRPVRALGRALLLSASFDFTERKQVEIELSKRAFFDDLTGLPNRTLIEERVEQITASTPRPPRFALAFIDIDNFKHINDYYTHAIGDALLVKVAQRIAAQIRPSDIIGRISGDEFLLVLNPLEQDDDLADFINNLLQQLKEPFLIEGFEILTSASIGVSVYPEHGLRYEMLRRAADTAMYQAKERAKGGAALFDTNIGRAMTIRMAHEQRLRLAVRDGRFCCAFQPKVDIRTQAVVGVEALIRLRDEDGVIQSPGEFIGLAIELGLIDDLTHLALAEIVRSIDLLDEAFGAEATISINVAAKQAADLRFMTGFCDELKATNYPSRFMIEVTEDAFLAKDHFQTDVLPMLRAIGTRVSVDDFGTGYSSLATLADITADEIKIDRSFITDIHQRPRSQSVLKAIEALSDTLGMTVIAEGVETVEEVAYLQAASRIRFAQGYYFAKPVLLEDLSPVRRAVGTSRYGANSRYRSRLRG